MAAQARKTPWLVTVLGRWEARSATEATVEPPATMSRNQEVKIPDERLASIGQRDAAAGVIQFRPLCGRFGYASATAQGWSV